MSAEKAVFMKRGPSFYAQLVIWGLAPLGIGYLLMKWTGTKTDKLGKELEKEARLNNPKRFQEIQEQNRLFMDKLLPPEVKAKIEQREKEKK